MFEFKEKDLMLDNLTTRTENHGPKAKVPAASMKFSAEFSNTILNEFAPGLLESLYKPEEDAEQSDIQSDMFPEKKFKKIKPISFDLEMKGYRLLVVNEMERKNNDHIIPDCTLKNFRIDLLEGGSVKVHFTVNARPEKDAIGYFYMQQEHNCLITLEAPEQMKLVEVGDSLEEEAA